MSLPLEQAWAKFFQLSLARHLAGVVLVSILLAIRFWGPLASEVPVEDERVYAAAFERVAQGSSPYGELQFYYLPPFASFGAWLEQMVGLPNTLIVLRGANLFALAALLWISAASFHLSFSARVVLAALFGALAPAVHLAMAWGNLSPLAIFLFLATFVLWRSRAILGGTSFALALLVKPVAPIAIVLLALHRRAEGAIGPWPQVLCGAVAFGLFSAAMLPSPYLREFAGLSGGVPAAGRSASLHHLLHCFGIELSAIVLLLCVAACSLALLRRRTRSAAELYGFAAVAGLFATPLVWSHTLLLVLPLEGAALAFAWLRYRTSRQISELVAVMTAILAIQLSNGLGGIEGWPLPVQGLFVALPCFAPLFLFLYLSSCLRAGRREPSRPVLP